MYVKKVEDLLARIGEKIGFPMQKYKRETKIKNSSNNLEIDRGSQ